MTKLFVNNKITYETRTVSFLIMAMKDDELDIYPSYQRDHVWGDAERQSLLRSIFYGFPIGSISVIEHDLDYDGPYIEVVDGKQRITAIYDFYNNTFPYVDDNGQSIFFKDMDLVEQREFKNQTLIGINKLTRYISEYEKYLYFYNVNFSGVSISNEHKEFILKKLKELKPN